MSETKKVAYVFPGQGVLQVFWEGEKSSSAKFSMLAK